MTLPQLRRLAAQLLPLVDAQARPGNALNGLAYRRIRLRLRTLASHASRLGIKPTATATSDGRDALAILVGLPATPPIARLTAEWALFVRLAEDALLGQGLPVAALEVSGEDST